MSISPPDVSTVRVHKDLHVHVQLAQAEHWPTFTT